MVDITGPHEGPQKKPEPNGAQDPIDQNSEWLISVFPPGAAVVPLIVDRAIWEIAKRVEVEPLQTEEATKLLYWAAVTKLYKEMGGRFVFKPVVPPTDN